MWQTALESVGVGDDPELARRSAERYNAYRVKYFTLFPGAIDLLRTLRERGMKLGIVTNGLSETHREKIALLQISEYFDAIFLSDEVGMVKPDPLLFAHACRTLGGAPAHARDGRRPLRPRHSRAPSRPGSSRSGSTCATRSLPPGATPPDATCSSIAEAGRILLQPGKCFLGDVSLDSIVIKGAREHNLKNVDLVLPRNRLIVVTGLSGSGKSSLAFDTIYAEGQRRYVESLSSYARQFLGQMEKPDVDYIEGLSPAISIDQKSTSRNPRSTVGTVTEDLRLPAPALRARRHAALLSMRARDQHAVERADRRFDHGAARGHADRAARAARARPQGRVREAFRGDRERGLHARARRRRDEANCARRSSSTRSASTRSRWSSTGS